MSVHIICKEHTNLGAEFLNGCLASLHEAGYPDEIVFINNSISKRIADELETWVKQFKEIDCNLKIIPSDLKRFADLRNLALEHTNPVSTYVNWIDSDEIYFAEGLDTLKNYIMQEEGISQIFSYFYHYMINPFQVQVTLEKIDKKQPLTLDDYRITKDNIFKYNKNLHWKSNVHEHMFGISDGFSVHAPNVEYLHYGYCRSQICTCLKWLHYAVLEHGNVNCYKQERIVQTSDGKEVTVDHFAGWRNPSTIVQDRVPYCKPYPCPEVGTKEFLPDAAVKLLHGCKNDEDWQKYITSLDGTEIWDWWQDLHKKYGNWKYTLDIVVERMEKENWNIIA